MQRPLTFEPIELARCVRSTALVSIIVPTLNEIDNVDALLAAIIGESGRGLEFEILVADGGSTDGTIERVRSWETIANVRLITGDGTRGLAGDVLAAAAHAAGDVAIVMDADFSHPPDRIRALVEPVLDGSSDMVIGSRHAKGGSTLDWPMRRQILSRLGALLAWPLTEVKDPMSGFFAVRRNRLLAIDPEAAGFKIGLEIIAQGGSALKVTEIPIIFRDRMHGQSKISKAQLIAYMRRLFVLAGGAVSTDGAARFAAVGLTGMCVDLLAFQALFSLGVTLVTAHIASFFAATVSNYFLNARWAFAERAGSRHEGASELYLRFLTVCLLALAVRGGALAYATGFLGLQPVVAVLCAIGAAAIVNYLGSAFYAFPSVSPRVPGEIRWRVAAIGIVSYVVVLRLLFLGFVDLLPQEAYYWNYSEHVDMGYLDHPPMVAWLIWAGTSVFGDNELGVRIPAWLGWFATAFFSFRLTHRLFGKSAAFVSLLLAAVLPFYFATGFLMTPDAPLVASWAGALYFLERALIGGQRNAWWGVGICIGLGMLSKYTAALLGPAVLLFLLVDTQARVWLRRPEPYLAALLALLIFSPVIYWNAENNLASFVFQGTRRVWSTFEFSLPMLVFNTAILFTPTVLIASGAALWALHRSETIPSPDEDARRVSRFILVFTLAPLFVFLVFSLTRDAKLNWTGPVWLAVLPAVSVSIVAAAKYSSALSRWIHRLWAPTIAISLVAYGLILNYLTLGIPGIGYPLRLPDAPVAWSEFGREAADLELEVMQATGGEPLMIGLDTYNVASQLAFYNNGNGDGAANSVGRGILGKHSLMYEFWHRAEPLRGRPAVMFSFKRSHILDPRLANYFAALSAPMERVVTKGGEPAGHFYYRIGYNFQASALQSSMIGAALLPRVRLDKCQKTTAGWLRCRNPFSRSPSVPRRAGRARVRRAIRRTRNRRHRGRDVERARFDIGASPASVANVAMVSLLLLLVHGCASEQPYQARVGRGSESETPDRNNEIPANPVAKGTCASLASTYANHIRKMEALRMREEAERREPPPTVALAFGRWFGAEGTGYAAAAELREERAKVDRLDAVLSAKGCSSIRTDFPLAR